MEMYAVYCQVAKNRSGYLHSLQESRKQAEIVAKGFHTTALAHGYEEYAVAIVTTEIASIVNRYDKVAQRLTPKDMEKHLFVGRGKIE